MVTTTIKVYVSWDHLDLVIQRILCPYSTLLNNLDNCRKCTLEKTIFVYPFIRFSITFFKSKILI